MENRREIIRSKQKQRKRNQKRKLSIFIIVLVVVLSGCSLLNAASKVTMEGKVIETCDSEYTIRLNNGNEYCFYADYKEYEIGDTLECVVRVPIDSESNPKEWKIIDTREI